MAQLPQQFNSNAFESKQEELLNETSGTLPLQCVICRQAKKALYYCDFQGCPQANRLICKKCGKNLHEIDDDDDSDDEGIDDNGNGMTTINHAFDVNASYVRKITRSMQLSQKDKLKIQASAREMKLMVKTAEENKISKERNKFELMAAFGAQAVVTVGQVGQYVPNAAYFQDAGQAIATALQNGQVNKFASEISTVLMDIGDASLEATEVCQEGAFMAAGFVIACEVAYHTFRFAKGDMTLKQYGKKIATATAVGAGGVMGNIGGSALGLAIGTFLCPGVGSQVGSFLGGLLGAVWVGMQAKKSVEDMSWFNDKNDQNYRHELLKEALIAFDFEYKDLTNREIFNEAEISRRYKARAREAHPDTRGGSEHKFLTLTSRMTMLLAILQQDDNVKQETSKAIEKLAITLPK